CHPAKGGGEGLPLGHLRRGEEAAPPRKRARAPLSLPCLHHRQTPAASSPEPKAEARFAEAPRRRRPEALAPRIAAQHGAADGGRAGDRAPTPPSTSSTPQAPQAARRLSVQRRRSRVPARTLRGSSIRLRRKS